jgi:GT2 family glycosyltransferase
MKFIAKKIDVVIPTLHGKNLYYTIKSLNTGSLRPRKIICVYYYKFNFYKFKKKFKNIYFVKSNIRNQVQQRIEGFKHVNSKYVLQLDDDIILEKNALLNLMKNKIKLGNNAVVGPVFLDLNNNAIHNLESNKYYLSNIYKYLICGANYGVNKIGTITSLGLSYGVNSNLKKKIIRCQWLPGGCVLLSRNILEKKYDKFILSKKSFCEDIFFSIQRRKKGFNHYTVTNSLVYTKIVKSKFNFLAYKSEIKNRIFLLKYLKGNLIRFYIWVFFEFSRNCCRLKAKPP